MLDRRWRTLIAPLALVLTAACGTVGKQATASSSPSASPPPPPAPAITKKEGEKALIRYNLALNAANARLSPRLAGVAMAGSLLQMEAGRYRVLKANHVRAAPAKYVAAEGFSPKESGYPQWFAAILTDHGHRPYKREIVVLAREHPGDPWRAVYAPLGWGNVMRAFVGHSEAKKTMTSVERVEMAAYVPPSGRGRVQILGTHWAPISIQGG